MKKLSNFEENVIKDGSLSLKPDFLFSLFGGYLMGHTDVIPLFRQRRVLAYVITFLYDAPMAQITNSMLALESLQLVVCS